MARVYSQMCLETAAKTDWGLMKRAVVSFIRLFVFDLTGIEAVLFFGNFGIYVILLL